MAETIREAPENTYDPKEKEGITPPAYFLSLTVSNFRCFGSEQTLDLSDGNGRPAQWTVLLGENGVGKTTLLQVIAVSQPSEKINVDMFNPLILTNYKNNFNLDKVVRSPDYLFPAFSINYSIGRLLKRKGSVTHRTFTFRHYGSDSSASDTFSASDTGLVCYGYGAGRISGTDLLSQGRQESRLVDTLFNNGFLVNAEEWLLQADYAVKAGTASRRETAENRLNRVKRLLIGILPDVSDFRFGTSSDVRMTPRVEAKTPYGWVRVADLSLGYKTSLTWMVDFASRLFEHYPDSENPLAEPAICLVDEIDLHLHPRWQRELVQKLTETFPNTQFIVTAHSPLIVQAAPNANIALLRREGDHVVINNDVDEIRNWRVDQILTSDLFGLETARSPRLEDALAERKRIQSHKRLTAADRKRLAELDTEVAEQTSVGENPIEMRALDALRRAAALLERDENKQTDAK